ncbi:hypothetical protein H696_05515 [Fonticula alba]|uniref:50S ribosomal protein L13 n=1 Tax=Fonticula alba TaxID=691883 RepID=A0A058Z1B0_FONAL|nr:hypothetical protein H696_05515 [Fonticula alba]KCV68049.1 hypothetical protein H696_05515 [Fonticula alba]|eukprot:XP_009497616.1 hypothetical protein H696_05515 [Fonticula alba]
MVYRANSATHLRVWHHIDATGQRMGRVATQVAKVLMGKGKPTYHPAADSGDYVVITNAARFELTGKKLQQRVHRYHTGYPGGLKEVPIKKTMETQPDVVFRRAVSGMLPKNNLRPRMLRRLRIENGASSPFVANALRSGPGADIVLETPTLPAGAAPRTVLQAVRESERPLSQLRRVVAATSTGKAAPTEAELLTAQVRDRMAQLQLALHKSGPNKSNYKTKTYQKTGKH